MMKGISRTITRIVEAFAKSVRTLCFPPLCLHCQQTVEDGSSPFCRHCTTLLHLLDTSERCPCCCSDRYCKHRRWCGECSRRPLAISGGIAAFEYIGPAATLVKQLKYAEQPYLAHGAAAYMAAQMLSTKWPIPDIIVPVPLSWGRRLARGYNQSMLLAKGMGKILNKPAINLLKRSPGDLPQAKMGRQQRLYRPLAPIFIKDLQAVTDKTVLIVDDVMTTGRTVHECAAALWEGCPASVYAITLCRAG